MEQRNEQNGRVTIATAIAVTWMRPVERIIHAVQMPMDTICISLDDPQGVRHVQRFLMQLQTNQLLWEIVVSGEGAAAERRVVPLE